MATIVYHTTRVSNLNANPAVKNRVGTSQGRLRSWAGTHELAVGTLITDLLIIERVHWSMRPRHFWLGWDDVGGTMTVEVGLWYPDSPTAPTVVDADEFASGLAMGTAAVMTDILFEANASDLDRMGKTLWEFAGLDEMPTTHGGMVDIGLYFTAATTPIAATISWNIEGTLND